MMLYVHTSDHETKRVSPPVLESACQGLGRRNGRCCLAQAGWVFLNFRHAAQDLEEFTLHNASIVYLQLLSEGFLSVSAIHTKWGPSGAMTGLSS